MQRPVYRRRHELTDAVLIALVDESFASIDLHGCGHIRPRTLVGMIRRLPMLQSLDISGCAITSQLIYSLPHSCPLLQLLRLSGRSTKCIDLRAWQRLIPRVLPGTADTWEDEVFSRNRCTCSYSEVLVPRGSNSEAAVCPGAECLVACSTA